MYSEYKNLETKNLTISDKKNLELKIIHSERDYCVPEKGVHNVILYVPHFSKGIFVFPPLVGCSDMLREAIAIYFLSTFFPTS